MTVDRLRSPRLSGTRILQTDVEQASTVGDGVDTVATTPSVTGARARRRERTRLTPAREARRAAARAAVPAADTGTIDPDIARQIRPFVRDDGTLDMAGMSEKLGDDVAAGLLSAVSGTSLTPQAVRIIRTGESPALGELDFVTWVTMEALAEGAPLTIGEPEEGRRRTKQPAEIPWEPWIVYQRFQEWLKATRPAVSGKGPRGRVRDDRTVAALREQLPGELGEWFDRVFTAGQKQEADWKAAEQSALLERKISQLMSMPKYNTREKALAAIKSGVGVAEYADKLQRAEANISLGIYPPGHPKNIQAQQTLKVISAQKAADSKVRRQAESEMLRQLAQEVKPLETTRYEITLPTGKTHNIDALTKEEAEQAAKQWGVDPAEMREIGAGRTMSAYEVADIIHTSAGKGQAELLDAMVKYSPSLSDQLIERIFPREVIEELVEHGGVTIQEPTTGQTGTFIGATREELQRAAESEANAKARGWACYAQIRTYSVLLTGGDRIYVEAFNKHDAKTKAEEATGLKAWATTVVIGTPDIDASIPPAEERAEIARMGISLGDWLGRQVAVRDGETGEASLMSMVDWEALPATLKEMITTKGFKAVQEYVARTVGEFEERLNETDPAMYDIYQRDGYDAYQEAFAEREKESGEVLKELRDRGCAKPRSDADPDAPEDERWDYDLVQAIAEGIDPARLRTVFGEEATQNAQDTHAAIQKLEKAGGSPTWALIHNQMTTEDARLLFGDDADLFIKAQTNWREAQRDKRELPWYDLPGRAGASLMTVHLLGSGAAEYMGTKYILPLQQKSVEMKDELPDEATRARVAKTTIARVGLGLFTGAGLMFFAGLTSTASFVAGIPLHLSDPDYLNRYKRAVARGFMDMGREAIADPVKGVSEMAGLILGPMALARLARVTGARLDPHYVESATIRHSFSTGKLPVTKGAVAAAIQAGRITEAQVARAVGVTITRFMKNPTQTASAAIGKTNITVHIHPTPGSKVFGGALWRATPVADRFQGTKHIVRVLGKEPAEFYSTHAAPRFALRSASGTPAQSPAIIMLYTKKGGLTQYPTSVQHAQSLSQMGVKGFNYLGSGHAKPGAYGPIKTYAGRFESEAMLPNGMTVHRVQTLRSRILGAKAGDFVTSHDGWVMPIYRFAEAGATVPHVTLSQLAALRVTSVWHGLKIALGKRGFGAEEGYVTYRAMAETLERVGAAATRGLVGASARAAYERAVDRAMTERLEELYRELDPAMLEELWKRDPQRFELAYLEKLFKLSARVSPRHSVDPRMFRPNTSYNTIRLTVDRDQLIRRAEEFDRAVLAHVRERGVARPERAGRAPSRALIDRRAVARMDRPPVENLRRTSLPERAVRAAREPIRRAELPRIRRIARDRVRVRDRVRARDRIRVRDRVRVPVPAVPRVVVGHRHEGKDNRIPAGSIAWAQGSLKRGDGMESRWFYIPPPYDMKDAIPLAGPPIGARNTDSIVPRETIQMIGRSGVPVPRKVSKDLGWADIRIVSGRSIEFEAGGLDTNIGTRIPVPTRGIALKPEGEILEVDTEVLKPIRTTSTRKAPGKARPKRRLGWLEEATSLKGFDMYTGKAKGE